MTKQEKELLKEFDAPDCIHKQRVLGDYDSYIASIWYYCAFKFNMYNKECLPFGYWFKKRKLLRLLNKIIPMHAPKKGAFFAYKVVREARNDRVNYLIAKLFIPEGAKISSAFGKKCRCSKAAVVEIYDPKSGMKYTTGLSPIVKSTLYRVGRMVKSRFNRNRFDECSRGIHFFMTKKEALDFMDELTH